MKHLVLIGMMGCGKSTVGGLLAKRLGRELVDTDATIEARTGLSVPEIFAQKGEGFFRDQELGVCQELACRRSGLVIACGGGLPLRAGCIGPLKDNGTVVFLNRDPGEIYDSVPMDGRPLGQGGRQAFLDRFARREPVYRRWADLVVEDFSAPEATARAILEGLRQ